MYARHVIPVYIEVLWGLIWANDIVLPYLRIVHINVFST